MATQRNFHLVSANTVADPLFKYLRGYLQTIQCRPPAGQSGRSRLIFSVMSVIFPQQFQRHVPPSSPPFSSGLQHGVPQAKCNVRFTSDIAQKNRLFSVLSRGEECSVDVDTLPSIAHVTNTRNNPSFQYLSLFASK